MATSSEYNERLFIALAQIPAGRVITYGELARRAGMPNGARLVGRILGELPADSGLPWHRVINAQGKISFAPDSAAFNTQSDRLRQEGVECVGGKIKLSIYAV